MYQALLVCTVCASVGVFGESCTTPTGQSGECVPIRSCSSLLWSFANPKYGQDESLKKFMCSNDVSGLNVCCRLPNDSLVFEKEENDVENNSTRLTNSKTCGITKDPIAYYNGTIGLQDFPWLVKILTVNTIYDKKDRVEKVGCTFALINRLYVLYSAQCHRTILLKSPYLFVRIDRTTGCKEPRCHTFENYDIEASALHPFYDAETKLNDIAMLRLSRSVIFSDYIQPICLPIACEHLKLGQDLYTAGWNRTFQKSDVSTKLAYKSEYISNEECNKNYSIASYEICTTSDKKLDEDHVIGYPLMSQHNDRWYLQGFESQGDESTRIHTRLSNYFQWIQGAMGGERCTTSYNETGECIHLSDCYKLNDALANASPKNEDALREFVCEYPHDDADSDTYTTDIVVICAYTLKVCCGLEPNFTLPSQSEGQNLQISNFEYCGLQHRDDYFSPNDQISVDEFPWLAVIVKVTLPDQKDPVCGGTLITQRYVLTSGHCISQFYTDDKIIVRLGDYNLKNVRDCIYLNQFDSYDCSDVQEYEVEKEIVHPFYNRFIFINDIALLRLSKKVLFSDYVRPICLPRSEEDLSNYGDTLFTTGFGSNEYGMESTTVKKKIRTNLISIEVCKEKLKLLGYINPITTYHICTEDFKNSTGVTCEGDEGGPVMVSKKHRWFIEGISSTYGCGDDEPQTHLKVYKYLKWLKFNIRE